MIANERLVTYLNALDRELDQDLQELEKKARQEEIPIIRKETQSFLRWLLLTKQPTKILEVGTAIGFSALLMARYNPVKCHITTIENYEKRIPVARENFQKAGLTDRITLFADDAATVLPKLEGTYDFIFMDAAKGQYLTFLPQVKRLLSVGGVLMTDNVLRDGDILESRFAVTRRNRTIHKRMREYLYEITHDEDLTCSILPLGDGVAVCTKKQRNGGDGS